MAAGSHPSAAPQAPAKRLPLLLFCWFGWVFDFYDLVLFSFSKRSIAADLALDPTTEIAWIEGGMLLATAVGALLFGRLADRRGRRLAMVASILTFSLGALCTGLATGYWSLLLARLVAGLGVGGEWGIGHAVVAEHWPAARRDRVHGLLQAGSPVAVGLAAAMAFFVMPLPGVGWRAVFLASAGLAGLALFARVAMPGPAQPPAAQPLPLAALWSSAHRRSTVVLLAMLTLHMTGFWCVYAELPSALIALHEVSAPAIGMFQLQVAAVQVVADIAFGFWAYRIGRLRLFVVFSVVFALGHFVLLSRLSTVTADFDHFAMAVVLLGLGAGTWSCFGALFGQHYPPALRATAAALCYALARAVQLPAKPVLAEVLLHGSFAPALWLGAGCALGSAVLVLCLPRREGQGG